MSKLLTDRIFSLDWNSLQQMLDEQGYAAIPALLDVKQCNEIIDTYEEKGLFRSTVNMARYRFGVGEYKYYQAPLPDLLQQLREGLYPELAKTANRWLEQLNRSPEYPETLEMFRDQCHQAGQNRPTPLILKYEAGGYNCLHQDLYGDISFPFQVVFTLNQRNEDYTGGEFLLIEQRPRAQSRGHVITLNRGEGLIFSTQYRPVLGTRGYYRVALRHGVSTVSSGMRYSLGVIFHDAK
ncbi:prolyl 4-hydroxylase subunit alpha [Bacillus pseudomycoides]|uniref:2OG-Fe(II) oxygenase n=1 Tax=Bacillus pseudomycoides TaxID=64104 RepID=UPI000BEBC0E1|nr:2OG-Fe(II) oxygenase [Bacillus pseudomycoides]PDX97108.1 prolyl 4-hydroxylase subunit alpha [Bacillus pseudomycoides]PEK73730.1 prolyl 4-hydroxylase subunit alpha [Bacillus pseudomycoides]PEN02993.1 prolyl 4-hydroxylase subunit alpha [Bacillus pseudomycoides]PGB78173.1 prolyl 4-hydroxylase subunit alpha [Bacillus pseudomycoides]PHE52970.1 prolyl 4-hydroxylase subunit alpha [Bacillus pseudomycoides]